MLAYPNYCSHWWWSRLAISVAIISILIVVDIIIVGICVVEVGIDICSYIVRNCAVYCVCVVKCYGWWKFIYKITCVWNVEVLCVCKFGTFWILTNKITDTLCKSRCWLAISIAIIPICIVVDVIIVCIGVIKVGIDICSYGIGNGAC